MGAHSGQQPATATAPGSRYTKLAGFFVCLFGRPPAEAKARPPDLSRIKFPRVDLEGSRGLTASEEEEGEGEDGQGALEGSRGGRGRRRGDVRGIGAEQLAGLKQRGPRLSLGATLG